MTSQASDQPTAIVAHNIRLARETRGLKQRELARLVSPDSDSQLVSRWERGVTEPNRDNWAQLEQVLGRSRGWFYVDRRTNGDHPQAA